MYPQVVQTTGERMHGNHQETTTFNTIALTDAIIFHGKVVNNFNRKAVTSLRKK
jgi:hypothetical protein